VLPKIHIFLWLLANNKLMTRDNLRKRMIMKPLDCVFCCENESVDHLFFGCVVAKTFWSYISSEFDIDIGANFESVARFWLSNNKNSALNTTTSALLWCLWKHRNSMIFDNTMWIFVTQVWRSVLRTIRYWSVLSKENCKERLDSFVGSLEVMIRQPLLILSG